jgi:hypothetical protein
MAPRPRAQFSLREAYLWELFGRKMAARHFDAKTLEQLPRHKNGKHTGLYQAKICWVKCEQAGWVSAKLIKAPGYTERRVGKVLEVHLMTDEPRVESKIIKSWYLR